MDKDSSSIQIGCIEDRAELLNALEEIEDKKGHLYHLSNKGMETTFMYIDLEAYNLTQDELETIMSKYRVIIVLKGVNKLKGVDLLNEKFALYSNIKEKVNG